MSDQEDSVDWDYDSGPDIASERVLSDALDLAETRGVLLESAEARLKTMYAFLGAIGVEKQCGKCSFPLFPGHICQSCGHDPDSEPKEVDLR